MEAYPQQYVEHNLPLIALSGLGGLSDEDIKTTSSGLSHPPGARISIDRPELPDEIGQALRTEIYKAVGTSLPWNVTGNEARPGLIGFRFSNVGRSLVYPRRKAAPPPQATPDETSSSPPLTTISGSHDLHSTLSPLSPTSPLYPDGLMTPAWMMKHQDNVPSVLLCFFEICADPSAASLQDNQLKTEIIAVKTALSKASFRTRLAVVLVTDKSYDEVEAFEERTSTIRRATGLDPKNSFFVLSKPEDPSKLSASVLDILVALQPVCIDYYRDLTKHARRKKNRGYVPPPTGSTSGGMSQILTAHGWNARYDFKQGVFAEFRQEMDAAERHYQSTIEELFNSEGVLETTPIWSARWEEGRCIADITALRLVRCQLWRSMTSGASETWSNYRDRTKALVDRRGKGTGTYGYAAWESRWAEVMGQLITRADLPTFRPRESRDEDDGEADSDFTPITIFAPPEKAYAAERLPPFRLLHHAGYYYRMARKWALERYVRARAVPDEDRTPPNQTPASQLADRTRSYDTYMAPPAHEEMPAGSAYNEKISAIIQALDTAAVQEFDLRKQYRLRAHVGLEQAKFLSDEGKYEDALDVLTLIWNEMSWRQEGWWDLAGVICRDLHFLGAKAGRSRLCAEVQWEMQCGALGVNSGELDTELTPDDTINSPIVLDSRYRLSPVSITFAFALDEGHVGDVISCQMSLVSVATGDSVGASIESIKIIFGDGSARLTFTHQQSGGHAMAQVVKLSDHAPAASTKLNLNAEADLALKTGQSKVVNSSILLREVGELTVAAIEVRATFAQYKFDYTYGMVNDFNTQHWALEGGKGLLPRSLDRDYSCSINVLPKPPRVQLLLGDLEEQYFTSEHVSLELQLVNEENQHVQGTLRFEVPDDILGAIELQWEDDTETDQDELSLYQTVDSIASSTQRSYRFSFRAPAEPVTIPITVAIDYSISDDPTPVTKSTTFNFKFIQPFATMYDLHPRLDQETWPSFFTLPANADGAAVTTGIRQKWSLSSRLISHALSPLYIEQVQLDLLQGSDNIACNILPPSNSSRVLNPSAPSTYHLPLITHRHSFDDRRPSPLYLSLSVTWRRKPSSAIITTTLPIPLLTIPPAEPRVLCTASPLPSPSSRPANAEGEEQQEGGAGEEQGQGQASTEEENSRTLTYTIENPSMHFLTFTLAMEASDQFAFSGPKLRNVSLPPLSRMGLEWRVMVLSTEGSESWDKDGGSDPSASARLEKGGGGGGGGGGDKKGGITTRGKWIYPILKVTDSYFNKTLRVLDAGEGVKGDDRRVGVGVVEGGGRGIGVWVPLSV
ncbi:hypothetical protein CAC42_7743 [Sphaceloma murrayae]|uniref:Trafficking protein particle complex subunit 11 n=1 Tax=Sphaceloma murrayae TaxID=2082308 RepID=A0A2K1QXJ1_9PEZI|nr:hypothetical protein CAC42_7743 [Sphaceloma murrayae]